MADGAFSVPCRLRPRRTKPCIVHRGNVGCRYDGHRYCRVGTSAASRGQVHAGPARRHPGNPQGTVEGKEVSIQAQLRRDEGYRVWPYKDTRGNLTWGIGHNLTAAPLCQEAADRSEEHTSELQVTTQSRM